MLEPANYICPICGNGSYLRYLDKLSKKYDLKCINCNSYFTIIETTKSMNTLDKKIAYICDGHASCSLRPGCFLREDPVTWSDTVCYHTLDPEHAKNGICPDPENHPERFTAFPEFDRIKYYERLPEEEI